MKTTFKSIALFSILSMGAGVLNAQVAPTQVGTGEAIYAGSTVGGYLNLVNTTKPVATSSSPTYTLFNMTGASYGNKFSIYGYPSVGTLTPGYGYPNAGTGYPRYDIFDDGRFSFNNNIGTPLVTFSSTGDINNNGRINSGGDISTTGVVSSTRGVGEGGSFWLNTTQKGGNTCNSYAFYNMSSSAGTGQWVYEDKFSIWGYNSGGGHERFSIYDNGSFNFQNVTGLSSFTISNTGTIGINALSPNARLQIATIGTEDALNVTSNGAINFKVKSTGYVYARDLTVSAVNFPDYVFGAKYKLMPLADVHDFITKNSHLPGMPTAAEVEKDGLSVSKINTLLVEKVEELTLYVIKLQEEVNSLKSKK